jgi:MFS family permease
MYLLNPALPFIAEACALIISVFIAVGMHEKAIALPAAMSRKAHTLALSAVSHLRKKAPMTLKAAIFGAVVSFLAGDILFSYYQPFFSSHAYSASTIGTLVALVSIFSAVGSYTLHYFHHRGVRAGAFVFTAIALTINAVGIATNTPQVVLVTMMLQAIANGLTFPTLRLLVNETTPSHIKASAFSAVTTFTSVGTMLGLLVRGLLADHGTPLQVGTLAIGLIALACAWYLPQLRRMETVGVR